MQSTTICPLKNWSCLRISGSGAEKLLQGQLTCDVARLQALQPQLGAYCNLQGKVVVSFYLIKSATEPSLYWMLLAKDLQALTVETLKKYAVFFEVQLEACDHLILGWWGEDVDEISRSAELISLPLSPADGRRLLITQQALASHDDDRAWRLADIQQGIVHIDASRTEQYLPNLLNYHLNGAVDFHKGCYRGQEIVARVHYRGQLKQRLARLTGPALAAEPVQNIAYEDKQSEVLSQVSIENDWHGLVLLPADLPLTSGLFYGVDRLAVRQWCFC